MEKVTNKKSVNPVKYLEDGKLVIKNGGKKYHVGAVEIQ